MIKDVASILRVCGIGSYLHIGADQNSFVFELLKRSIDAYGIEASEQIVAKNLERAPGRFVQGSLKKYPFNPEVFDTIIVGNELFDYTREQLNDVFQKICCMTKRNLVLAFSDDIIHSHPTKSIKPFWEQIAIKAGFRRHPRGMLESSHSALESEKLKTLTFFERVPSIALEQYPHDWLEKNPEHKDMLRNSGRLADAAIARYALACSRIRSGTIVDVGCGLGAGLAKLAACLDGVRCIGVDWDADAIAYAKANYGYSDTILSYHTLETNLSFLPDHSVDTVICLDTLEYTEKLQSLLTEIHRVLKPDGYFWGSVATIETKHDSKLQHKFDWNKLKEIISQHFIIDGRWAQLAGGGSEPDHAKRDLKKIALTHSEQLYAEWWIFSANVDPRQSKQAPYANPFYPDKSTDIPIHVDFEKFYENPWLYRVIVQQGERFLDETVLNEFCVKLINETGCGSADHGAALCVIAYRLLECGHVPLKLVKALVQYINAFDQAYDKKNPHACRWAISLYFVAGRLLLAIGNREDALAAFLACADMDPLPLSPLLATKTISARMQAGIILVGNTKIDEARKQFSLAIKEAHRVLQGDWKNILGDFDQPLLFGLPEAADVLTVASQCAGALRSLDRQKDTPGLFWDRINMKFFGLLEWNRGLEKENNKLRQKLQELQTEPSL